MSKYTSTIKLNIDLSFEANSDEEAENLVWKQIEEGFDVNLGPLKIDYVEVKDVDVWEAS